MVRVPWEGRAHRVPALFVLVLAGGTKTLSPMFVVFSLAFGPT